MKPIDLILIAALAAAIFFAVRRTVRQRRAGGCGCGCDSCPSRGSCAPSKPREKT